MLTVRFCKDGQGYNHSEFIEAPTIDRLKKILCGFSFDVSRDDCFECYNDDNSALLECNDDETDIALALQQADVPFVARD